MSETLSLAEAKAHLSELVSRVDRQHDRVTVTVHGRPSGGKRLRSPLEDRHSARRGTYRVIDRIDDEQRRVTVVAVVRRSGAYR